MKVLRDCGYRICISDQMQVVPSSENLGQILQNVIQVSPSVRAVIHLVHMTLPDIRSCYLFQSFIKMPWPDLNQKRSWENSKGSFFTLSGAVLALSFQYWTFFGSDHVQKKKLLTTVTCQSQNVQGKTREHPHILVSQKEGQLLWGSHTATIKKSENWSLPKHRPEPSVPSRNFVPLKSEVIAMNKDLPEAAPNDDLAAPLCN